jgi:hypothetical protein
VTAQGSAGARFKRAPGDPQPTIAAAGAAELPRVFLADALALLLVCHDAGDRRFGRAAVRWHGRRCLEVGTLAPDDAQLCLAAIRGLAVGDGGPAALSLRAVLAVYGADDAATVLGRWLERPRSERLLPCRQRPAPEREGVEPPRAA